MPNIYISYVIHRTLYIPRTFKIGYLILEMNSVPLANVNISFSISYYLLLVFSGTTLIRFDPYWKYLKLKIHKKRLLELNNFFSLNSVHSLKKI